MLQGSDSRFLVEETNKEEIDSRPEPADLGSEPESLDEIYMSDPERTLLEVLLEAAFGVQCRNEAGEPPVQGCAPPPDDPGVVGVKSLLALDGVLARGYSLRCEIADHREHPDPLQREPHGHGLRMW